MANKIFRDMLKPNASLSRNGFDRSYLHNFTAKIGELLPIMSIETVPGSHYEINVSDMMRTIPMNQAAFIRASQHFEFYFVPFKQLWHRWDDFFTKRSMPISAAQSFNVPAYAPNCDLDSIIDQFKAAARLDGNGQLTTGFVGDLGEAIGQGCSKIFNLLGYGSSKKYVDWRNPGVYASNGSNANGADMPDYLAEKSPNLLRAAAYQKIFYDYYRQPFYDLPFDGCQYAFNLDDANLNTGKISETVSSSDARATYRLARLFQMHYRQWKKDIFTGVLPNTQFGAVAVVGTGSSSGGSVSVNLDVATQLVNRAVDINIPGVGIASAVGEVASKALFVTDPSYDSETDTTVFNISDIDRFNSFYFGNDLTANGDASITSRNGTASVNQGTAIGSATGSINVPGGTGSFNVLQLVQAQALQRWREITLRSGFRATEQYEGHFGVKPIFSDKDKCVFIDSVSSPLQVNTVTNTNAGASIGDTNIPLGDLGANGTSVLSSDKTIKFDAKDFGVIMCIYSMLPEATYQHEGLDLMNQKVLPDDFFVPEFENIGMSPVPMSMFKYGSSDGTNGFAAHYFEYKVGLDIQADEFRPTERVTYSDTASTFGSGSFYGWSPSRQISLDVSQSGIVSPAIFARDLYVSPMYFRDIFSALPYYMCSVGEMEEQVGDETVTRQIYSDYSAQLTIGDSKTDTFVHQAYFDVKCVQPMSVLGLPRY